MSNPDTTDFGYQTVPTAEKAARVAQVFHQVAQQYDLMNDLMSLGMHRLWKRQAVAMAGVRQGMRVLDLAGGTADLARQFQARVGASGQVIVADINDSMLQVGRARCLDNGQVQGLSFVQTDAQMLPFADNYFDVITIAFGLRNVTDKAEAIRAMSRVLKPQGQCLVVEFSQPEAWLQPIYDAYSFSVLPRLGEAIAGDADSYQYLAESIRKHPNQAALKTLMLDNGFANVTVHNLSSGIVAIHQARLAS